MDWFLQKLQSIGVIPSKEKASDITGSSINTTDNFFLDGLLYCSGEGKSSAKKLFKDYCGCQAIHLEENVLLYNCSAYSGQEIDCPRDKIIAEMSAASEFITQKLNNETGGSTAPKGYLILSVIIAFQFMLIVALVVYVLCFSAPKWTRLCTKAKCILAPHDDDSAPQHAAEEFSAGTEQRTAFPYPPPAAEAVYSVVQKDDGTGEIKTRRAKLPIYETDAHFRNSCHNVYARPLEEHSPEDKISEEQHT